ncbi:MAG: LysR family transcriptional regulator [Bryobacterales bacterium]|nr:LysR family transcriptional regulator [Bryobacterales bacterium]MBV9399807.1 LysR family transcriptional regulator [Bryobacterales bacterium]
MTYENIKLFRDIAQTHSFSRGASTNGISQSAASQHVQELERSLGVELLDRSTRPLTITPAGRLYLEFCRDILRRKDDFEAALQRIKEEVEGTLRVASIYSVGLSEMVELEREFSLRQPEAKLQVQYLRPEKIYEAVLAGEADLGLISYPEARRDITVIPWRHEEMVLAVAPAHPLAHRGGAISAQELRDIDFIAFDDDLPIRRHLDRFLKENGAEVNIALHFDNIQMIKEAVTHNVGISIMPFRTMREDIEQGRLAAVRIADATLSRPLGIIHRKKKRFHRVAQAFLDLLRETPVPEAAMV